MNDGRFCDGHSGDWQQFSVESAGHRFVAAFSLIGCIVVVGLLFAGVL